MAEIAREPMDERQLVALLQREYQAADQYRQELDQLRTLANDYYDGRPFGNEMDGMSQVVLPDVQETIDYMTASILRTFASGERVVEFEATDEADESAADDATEALNYSFLRLQDGYRLLHDGTKDGLLNKIGVFKTVVETEEYVSREDVIADPLQLEMLPEGMEVEEATDNGDGTVTATIKRQRVKKCFRDYAIAPWLFLFSPNARHEDHADYLAHVEEKNRSDLVEMGFDVEQVYGLPAHGGFTDRHDPREDELDWQDAESSAALEKVLLCEEYARIDVDGDGIAERVKIFRVEGEILRNQDGSPSVETVDDQPFAVFTPFPRQHRLAGDSLAEKVMDIQLVRSEVARQLLNGMAFANLPRPVVDTLMATTETLDDILSPIPGSPIRVKGGVASVQPFQTGFDVGKSLNVMEWMTGERESRTGITRLNQGLDADALNKTASGTAMMQAAGQQQEEFIARNLAETLARLFVKKYKLMRAEAEPFSIRVDGKYRQVDPSSWPEEMNIVVRTGLGSGSKDRRVQARMAMSAPLQASVEAGFSGPEHVFNWFDGIARDTGIGKGDEFAYDPATPEAQERAAQEAQQPDPEVQAKMAELASEEKLRAAKLEGEQQMAAFRLESQREEARQKQQLAREEAEFEAKLAVEKMNREFELAEQRMARETAIAARKAEMSTNRPGGSLAE
jgi:hypothetical protein